MQTANAGAAFFGSIDTALSDTARELRTKVQSAMDPPRTSRHVRRAQLKENLRRDAIQFHKSRADQSNINRMLASVSWAEAFIDMALATTPEPEIAVDADGEVLFEWFSGPREVVTVSVGPGGVINFASLTGSNRFHGVTRIGDRIADPLLACLAQLKAPAAT